jgi:hypothetical protein
MKNHKNIESNNNSANCWEKEGESLLFPKDKIHYTEEELLKLKKLLTISPPPPYFRKKVRL